jgi:PKHD-type hydroxylase
MFYGNPTYYWFKDIVPTNVCDQIVNHFLNLKQNKGLIGNLSTKKRLSKEDKKNLKKTRQSNVIFDNPKWIYDIINPIINQANKEANWNLEVDFNESVQFTIYNKNQFYDWHADTGNIYKNDKNINFNNKTRKLSLTLQLTDPKNYSGGELQFKTLTHKKVYVHTAKEALTKGSVIIFPSQTIHRVKPVTKGTRYSLVNWSLGYPVK